jgi:hypothetical protein
MKKVKLKSDFLILNLDQKVFMLNYFFLFNLNLLMFRIEFAKVQFFRSFFPSFFFDEYK